jgi:uncharacterized protein (TIGR03089 family)
MLTPSSSERRAARSLPGWPPDTRNLSHLIRRRVSARGHAPFLTYFDDTTGERTEFSYATFDNWVSKTANLLSEEFNAGRGSRVALAVGAHWTAVVTAFACWRIGACVAPVVWEQDDAAPGEVVGRTRPDVVVAWEELAADLAAQLAIPTIAIGPGFSGRLTTAAPGAFPYADEVLAFGDDFDDPDVRLDDPALLVAPTHGSGASVVLDQGNLLAGALALEAWGELAGDDRLLSTDPLGPVDGLALCQLGPFVAGAASALVRNPDPRRLARRIRDERITWAALPSPQLDGLSKAGLDAEATPTPGGSPPNPLGRLRGFVCPTGVPPTVRDRVEAATGLRVHSGHGLVTATCASSLDPIDLDDSTRAWLNRQGGVCAGSPTAWAQVTERDGELCVRGPVVMAGHDARPDLDAVAFADGWLHTGDQGMVIEGPDGRTYVLLQPMQLA